MSGVIALILVGSLFFFESFRGRNKRKEENTVIQLSGRVISQRATRLPLIEEWIRQLSESRTRVTIERWKFLNEDTADKIAIQFPHEEVWYEGRITVKMDGHPRITSFVYNDKNGRVRKIAGYRLPNFSLERLVSYFKVEKSSPEKIAYVNEVADVAFREGEAIFDMAKYFDVPETEIKKKYNLKEIEAFCKTMSEDETYTLKYDRKKKVITLMLRNEPA